MYSCCSIQAVLRPQAPSKWVLLQVGKSYASAKEAIIMTGNFVLEHLQKMDSAAGGKATFAYGGTAFVNALKSEVKARCRCLADGIVLACLSR